MARLNLTSGLRTDFRKSETKRLRREGHIPGTLYGRGADSISISIPADEFVGIIKSRGGRLSVIDLVVEGTKTPATVMIQTVQRDPVSKSILHVDLHRVQMDEPVHARVPIQLKGDAPGIKQGGILEHFTREIEVKALPDHVPSHIEVDVSELMLGDIIHVRDLGLPSDVEIIHTSGEGIVATVRMPIVRVEEVAAAPEGEAEAPEEAAAGETPAAE